MQFGEVREEYKFGITANGGLYRMNFLYTGVRVYHFCSVFGCMNSVIISIIIHHSVQNTISAASESDFMYIGADLNCSGICC